MDNYRIAAIDVHKSMLAVVVTDAAVEANCPSNAVSSERWEAI